MEKISNSEWSDQEEKYNSMRDELLVATQQKKIADSPFLFAKRQTICSALTRIELFKKILNVKGSIVECGVYTGNSLMLYYHLSSVLEPYALNRKIIGFDTFEGFRSLSSAKDCEVLKEKDFSDTDYDLLNSMVEMNDLNRPLSHIPKAEIIKGDATITIPEFKKEHPELIIALLYLDFDIYEPTKIAIQNLLDLVPKGGIVAFDELNAKKWKGETVAFKEAFNLKDVALRKFHFDPWPSYFIVGE